ncbi:class I SAM-dependent methyltransferase [Kordiimonas sediminis]|nr:class I SAM-dependent methyltransferase [Kordiimonas sediminis]
MGLYENHILPKVINFTCGLKPIRYQRKKVVPHASGKVLEIGMGTGLNMPYYTKDSVERIFGLEPNLKSRELAEAPIRDAGIPVDMIGLDGQDIPLDDNSVDTVVLTYTLCTIPDAERAMREMRRVLKPGGRLLFSEHGKAPDEAVRKWQDRINPVWKALAGGCNLNRDIPSLIIAGGFSMEKLDQQYIPGPKFANYTYWGSAT